MYRCRRFFGSQILISEKNDFDPSLLRVQKSRLNIRLFTLSDNWEKTRHLANRR